MRKGPRDAGFVHRDGLWRVAEQVGVVEPNLGHGGHRRLDDRRRIVAPAEADLHHGEVDAGLGKDPERERGHSLEERRARGLDGLDPAVGGFREGLGLRHAVDPDHLGRAEQARRGEKPHAEAAGGAKRRDVGRRGALAIGPADVDDPKRHVRIAHRRQKPPDAILTRCVGRVRGLAEARHRKETLEATGRGRSILRHTSVGFGCSRTDSAC